MASGHGVAAYCAWLEGVSLKLGLAHQAVAGAQGDNIFWQGNR
jgi:hypothetical protein